jgi:hypothetical protein
LRSFLGLEEVGTVMTAVGARAFSQRLEICDINLLEGVES